jgi:hypothetical protein
VTGDIADDQHWCNFSIPENRFPQEIHFRVNDGIIRRARRLSIRLLHTTDPITYFILESATVSAADFLELKVLLASLAFIEIHDQTLFTLQSLFLCGHSALEVLIVHGDIEISALALEGLRALRTVEMREVSVFSGSVLRNCTALELVDLRSVETVQASTFAALTSPFM